MDHGIKSIRAFIGAEDYSLSRAFYQELGFKEIATSEKMSYFSIGDFGFYLQEAYVKDWVDNSMIFLEVENVEKYRNDIVQLNLPNKYDKARLSEIVVKDWGKEFFLHDPSGVLWHIGKFN